MKKSYWITGIILVVLVGGIWAFIHQYTSGDTYYVQITTDGKKVTSEDDKGEKTTDYSYTLNAYDKDGKWKKLTFNANRDTPLRKNAYLKLTVKGTRVLSWEEAKRSELPAKVSHLMN